MTDQQAKIDQLNALVARLRGEMESFADTGSLRDARRRLRDVLPTRLGGQVR